MGYIPSSSSALMDLPSERKVGSGGPWSRDTMILPCMTGLDATWSTDNYYTVIRTLL